MGRPTYLQVNLQALQHNLACVRTLAPKSRVLAMIKANGYGHGLKRIAKALSHADALGVACIDEAILLRDAGITTPIVLMEGLFAAEELSAAAKYQLTLVVHHRAQIDFLETVVAKDVFSIWLKINTGMHRLGIKPEEIQAFYKRLNALSCVKKPVGLMTHFAEADLLQSEATTRQMQLFENMTSTFSVPKSLANSAAILKWPQSHRDWVRPGLMLYGVSPFENTDGTHYQLQPVMSLHSQLIAINEVKRGGKVGYGGTWTAPEDMRIGVVGVGYGDGYPQFAANGTPLLVNRKPCPLAGRVSMDMLTVDLRTQPNAQIGDEVLLWGEGLPVEVVACHSKTSPYEILTGMTSRPKVEVVE